MKDIVIEELKKIDSNLKQLRSIIKQTKVKFVYKNSIRDNTQKISRTWFDEIKKKVILLGFDTNIIVKYDNLFNKLILLSMTNSRKNTYLKTIDEILENFKKEIMMPIITSTPQTSRFEDLSNILENVSTIEKEYLQEAIGCSKNNFFRASIVMAWNATIHRIHKKIENLGFNEFNKKTVEMKKIKEGRFKRFNKSFNVHSLSELRASVFDADILWVLEFLGLIDANQHERLSICLTMRNNCAHPGEAPLTEENLISFYSDLKKIIFNNEKFKLL
jgi:hypothetical protein